MLLSRTREIHETHTSTSFNLRPVTSMQMLCSRTGEIQETQVSGPRISHIPTYMYKQLQQHFQSTPTCATCISNNIYSTAQLIMVSTSTAQLLASQDMNRLFRLCVHPGPLSSHISQPLVASFDKTVTVPQTEPYRQSCNSWCKILAKAVTSIPFLKGYVPYGSTHVGGSDNTILPRISHEIIVLFPIYTLMYV